MKLLKKIIPIILFLSASAYAEVDILPCDGQSGLRHSNGGGFVSRMAYVDATVFIAETASVCDYASVFGSVKLFDHAVVADDAIVLGNVELYDNVIVKDSASVSGDVIAKDNVLIHKTAMVGENAELSGDAIISGRVEGTAVVTGKAHITNIIFSGLHDGTAKKTHWLSFKKIISKD